MSAHPLLKCQRGGSNSGMLVHFLRGTGTHFLQGVQQQWSIYYVLKLDPFFKDPVYDMFVVKWDFYIISVLPFDLFKKKRLYPSCYFL